MEDSHFWSFGNENILLIRNSRLKICYRILKVAKMGSIIGQRVDYGGAGGSERPAAHFQKKIDPGTSPGLGPSKASTASYRARLFAVSISYPYL